MIINIRIWIAEKGLMLYPSSYLFQDKKIITFVDENKYISTQFMHMTNGTAMNGEIYEGDILVDTFENKFYLIIFDCAIGAFKGINGLDEITIKSEMYDYEIVGNKFETPDVLKEINTTGALVYSEVSNDDLETIPVDMIDADIDFLAVPDDLPPDVDVCEQENSIPNPIIDDVDDSMIDVISNREKRYDDLDIPDEVHIFVGNAKNLRERKCSFSYYVEGAGQVYMDSGVLRQIKDIRKAELETIIYALCLIKGRQKVKIFSSSSYVTSPFIHGWITKWSKNNWRKEKTNIKIKDSYFFEKLFQLTQCHDVTFVLDENNPIVAECEEKAKRLFESTQNFAG